MGGLLLDAVALVIFCGACGGLGCAMCSWLAMPDHRLAMPLGFGLVAFLFSGLAAFELLHAWTIAIVLALGCAALWPRLESARHEDGVAISLSLTASWSLAYLLIPVAINATDDTNAYLAFSVQAGQSGYLQAEPFSERRLFSQDTPALIGAALRSVFGAGREVLLEPAIGMTLLALAVSCQPTVSLLRKLAAITCVFASGLFGSTVLANTAPAYSVALLAFGFMLLLNERKLDRSTLWCLATLLPAAVSLRATLIPFLALAALVLVIRNGRDLLAISPVQFVGPLLVAALQFAPHAVNSYRSTGTPLFPAWQAPTHGVALNYLTPVIRQVELATHATNVLLGAAAIFVAYVATLAVSDGRRLFVAGLQRTRWIFALVLFSSSAVILLTSGIASSRYITPVMLAFVLVVICSTRTATSRSSGALGVACLLAPLLLMFIWSAGEKLPEPISSVLQRREVSRQRLLGTLPEQRETLSLAERLPPGSTVLVEDNAFLLHGKPLRVLANDQPGVVGPLPGWQVAAQTDLSAYLRAAGIDFVLMKGSCRLQEETRRTEPVPWLGAWRSARERYYVAPLCATDSVRRMEASFHTLFDLRAREEQAGRPIQKEGPA